MAYKEVYRHAYNGGALGKAQRSTSVEYYAGISTWDDLHDGAATGSHNTGGYTPIRVESYLMAGYWWGRIDRGMVWFDADLPAGSVITRARLKFATAGAPLYKATNLYFVTANDVEPPVVEADYATLKGKTTVVAIAYATELERNKQYVKDWNSGQLDKIQLTGLTGVGIRLFYDLQDIDPQDPPTSLRYHWIIDDDFTLQIWYNEYVYPTNPITRVSGLIHHFNRASGLYRLEVMLGSVHFDWRYVPPGELAEQIQEEWFERMSDIPPEQRELKVPEPSDIAREIAEQIGQDPLWVSRMLGESNVERWKQPEVQKPSDVVREIARQIGQDPLWVQRMLGGAGAERWKQVKCPEGYHVAYDAWDVLKEHPYCLKD